MSRKFRQHPRDAVTLRVDYVDTRGRAGMGLAKNVSFSGMYLAYNHRVHVGDTLTMAFALPTGKPCKLQAQVVRADTTGIGVRFSHGMAAYLALGEEIN